MSQLFTDLDAWLGGFYELNMELPTLQTIDVATAIAALWSLPDLFGGFARKDCEPNKQQLLPDDVFPLHEHRYGVAQVGTSHLCACGSYTVVFESASTWLSLYLPIGGLIAIYPVLGGFPFDQATTAQRRALNLVDKWLFKQAVALHPRVLFTFAVIGFESDYSTARERASDGIPNERMDGLVIPTSSGVNWYPPTA
jgi:hypothetical protein